MTTLCGSSDETTRCGDIEEKQTEEDCAGIGSPLDLTTATNTPSVLVLLLLLQPLQLLRKILLLLLPQLPPTLSLQKVTLLPRQLLQLPRSSKAPTTREGREGERMGETDQGGPGRRGQRGGGTGMGSPNSELEEGCRRDTNEGAKGRGKGGRDAKE